MNIAIPVNNNSIESNVNTHFGRTPYFLIHNTKTNENFFIENDAAISQGGAGIKAAQIVVDQNVDALITPQCGAKAAELIKAANIKMYESISNSIQDNIELFNKGKLYLLSDIHSGFHNNGAE